MDVVILAAGRGERLEPFTYTRPKPLIPVMNKPIIHHIIDALENQDFDRVFIVVSHHADKVIKYVEELGVNIRPVFQGEPKGTGDAVLKVLDYVKPPFLLIYGDILVERNIIAILRRTYERGGYNCVLLGVNVEHPEEYGVLYVDENNLLKGIIEKPKFKVESNLINGGVYIVDEKVLEELKHVKPSPRGEIEFTDAINNAVKAGCKVKVVTCSRDEWVEVGKPWDILSANAKFLDEMLQTRIEGYVEDNVKIKGRVVIEEGAEVLSGTYIIGPAYIGRNSRIGPNAYIRPYTIIGDGVVIGNAVEVKGSVIMSKTHIAHLSYVGDSVIGEGVNFGAGTITANLRFDEKPVPVRVKGVKVSSGRRKLGAFVGDYVKTGINVSLMPGVKIGAYSWIAPGLVIYDGIPPHSFVKGVKGGYEIVPLREGG